MAILKGGKFCRLREVELRRMPEQLTIISPKATVPVLVQETGELLELFNSRGIDVKPS